MKVSNCNYNGWTNWDTWNASLWLNNDENTYTQLTQCSKASEVRELFLESFDDGSNCHDGIDYGCVNWYEIFESVGE